jgi:hypothetical protein
MTAFHGSRVLGTAMMTLFILGQTFAADAKTTNAPRPLNNVRSSDTYLMQVLDQGLARSATLRELQAHLEHASVIVYLARAPLPQGLAGRTRIIGTGGIWRFLSVEVDNRAGPVDLLALVGHELQHVIEIADAPEVVDGTTMAAFYRRVGTEWNDGRQAASFETKEALEAGRRVQMELTGWAW